MLATIVMSPVTSLHDIQREITFLAFSVGWDEGRLDSSILRLFYSVRDRICLGQEFITPLLTTAGILKVHTNRNDIV